MSRPARSTLKACHRSRSSRVRSVTRSEASDSADGGVSHHHQSSIKSAARSRRRKARPIGWLASPGRLRLANETTDKNDRCRSQGITARRRNPSPAAARKLFPHFAPALFIADAVFRLLRHKPTAFLARHRITPRVDRPNIRFCVSHRLAHRPAHHSYE